MIVPPPALQTRERGAALLTAVICLVVVTAFSTTLLTAVNSERVGVVLEADRLQSLKLAEGVLEIAESELLQLLGSHSPPADPPAGAPFQVLEGDFVSAHGTLHWTVSRATTVSSSGAQIAVPVSNRIDALTGLQLTIEPYVLETDVTIGTSAIRMVQHLEIQKTPIFQFLAYYDGDCEILPGPAMVLNGRIHTNSDLYMTAGTSLSVASNYVRTAGRFHRHRKDPSASANGWIKIKDATSNALVTLPSQSDLVSQGIGSIFGLDSDFTGWDLDGDGSFDQPGEMPPFKSAVTELFHGTLQTGEHGITGLQTPAIAAIQPYVPDSGGSFVETGPGTFAPVAAGTGTHSKSHFHQSADLVVINDQVFNRQGVNITGQMPAGFIQVRNVWDQREGRTVACTEVDVGRLGDMDGDPLTCDRSPHYPANGLLYATRTGAGAAGGVVLTNATEINVPQHWNSHNYGILGPGATVSVPLGVLPPPGAHPFSNAEKQGLTVVSPIPVYVHGDYNTIGKKPAAVISDAINLLSKAWDFTKGPGDAKSAADTTYNLAMIMGHNPTNGAQYSGGFENLPRFHENWSGQTCTITGSFVSPWFSSVATGPWVYGGAWYEAPNRNWSYDTMFDQGGLPPFTPMVIASKHLAWEVKN